MQRLQSAPLRRELFDCCEVIRREKGKPRKVGIAIKLAGAKVLGPALRNGAFSVVQHSSSSGFQIGVRRVAEIILGCLFGAIVSWFMSKVWREPDAPQNADK